jgi:hypothetical protein
VHFTLATLPPLASLPHKISFIALLLFSTYQYNSNIWNKQPFLLERAMLAKRSAAKRLSHHGTITPVVGVLDGDCWPYASGGYICVLIYVIQKYDRTFKCALNLFGCKPINIHAVVVSIQTNRNTCKITNLLY